MQVLMFLLLIVGNMRNMQYDMQQYAKYANTISICRICTPHFADVVPPPQQPSSATRHTDNLSLSGSQAI